MNIRMLVMDVDGTLTDGKIYIGDKGELMKAFDVKDGYAIANMLSEMGIIPVIITGRTSKIVEARATELKIKELHQGVSDKLSMLKEVAARYELEDENVAYIGDDLNDLECMKWCGLAACPADAVEEVRVSADVLCEHCGGNGAVRELVELIKKKMKNA